MNDISYKIRTLAKLSVLWVLAFSLSACLVDTTPRILQVEEEPTVTEEEVITDEDNAVGAENVEVEELEVEEGEVAESDLEAIDEAEAVVAEDVDTEAAEVIDLSTVLVRATFLINREVENADGQDIGVIEDFLVDAETGRILYAIMGYGGLLSIGDEDLAVPLSALAWNPELEMALAVDESVLEALPTVDEEWPLEFTDAAWDDEVFAYWTEQGIDVVDATDSVPIRLAGLFNHPVGEPEALIGPIEDFLLNLGQGEVRYIAVFADPSFYTTDQIVFVPFSQLEVEIIDAEPVPAVVIERETFAAAPLIERSLFLTVNFLDAEFSQALDESWSELSVPTE
jgi:hypothetical protein